MMTEVLDGITVPLALTAEGKLIQPPEAWPGVDYQCTSASCGGIVRLRREHWRQSALVCAHFFHLSSSGDCSWQHGETDEHCRAKISLAKALPEGIWPQRLSCGHAPEQPFPVIQGEARLEQRVTVDGVTHPIDVAVYDPSGALVALIDVQQQGTMSGAKREVLAKLAPVYEFRAPDILGRLPLRDMLPRPCVLCPREAEAARQVAQESARLEAAGLRLALDWEVPRLGGQAVSTLTGPYFSGRVHSIVYSNPANAYLILKMALDGASPGSVVGVKGTIPGLSVQVGTWFGFEAKWVDDAVYGRQLVIIRAPVMQGAWTPSGAFRMLTANGVSSQVLHVILGHFGPDRFLAALDDSSLMEVVPGISKFAALHIQARWTAMRAFYRGLDYLSGLGLPAGLISNVWAHFGERALTVLASDPWALVEVEGITFAQADEVARRSGLADPDARLRGAVLYACKANKAFGHLYLRTGSIYQAVQNYLGEQSQDKVLEALVGLHKAGTLVIDRGTRPGTAAVYEPGAYAAEKQSAELLQQRNQKARLGHGEARTVAYLTALGSVGPATRAAGQAPEEPGTDRLSRVAWAAIAEWGQQAQLKLSDHQKQGVFHALTAPVSILSGLPGTGKTVSLQAVVRILQEASVTFLLVAPTGIAAKNLLARTGASASTIHRAFEAKGMSEKRASGYMGVEGTAPISSAAGTEGWGYGPGNVHPAEVVIVDESSMADQQLLLKLLECTRPDARLVFVGDHAQLPSVGPGNVLRDLISSKLFPTVQLTQVFRQADTSGIIYAAHAIHDGAVPEINKDFRLLALQSEEDVLEAVLKIAAKLAEADRDFQVLSPRHAGTVGVTKLNTRLRELLNPESPGRAEVRLNDDTIREGDRVMVIQNDYKLGVYNGDVGQIIRVDRGKHVVDVQIQGVLPQVVPIEFRDVPKLIRLAYATTIHKCQGLEFDYIVMPLVQGFQQQLQRNLLYTAITRARTRVYLVGHLEALRLAVINAREDDRATLFLDRLLQVAPSA